MSTPAKRAGARWFIAGSVGFIVTGLLHFWAQFVSGPPDSELASLHASMRSHTFDGLGMTFSLMDVMQCLGLFFTLLCVMTGIQNLAMLRASGSVTRTVRLLAPLSSLAALLLITVAIVYQVPPPLFTLLPVLLCFLIATGVSLRSSAAA